MLIQIVTSRLCVTQSGFLCQVSTVCVGKNVVAPVLQPLMVIVLLLGLC